MDAAVLPVHGHALGEVGALLPAYLPDTVCAGGMGDCGAVAMGQRRTTDHRPQTKARRSRRSAVGGRPSGGGSASRGRRCAQPVVGGDVYTDLPRADDAHRRFAVDLRERAQRGDAAL